MYKVTTCLPPGNCIKPETTCQTTENVVLCYPPARPTWYYAFARWFIIILCCLDVMASFVFGTYTVQTCFDKALTS